MLLFITLTKVSIANNSSGKKLKLKKYIFKIFLKLPLNGLKYYSENRSYRNVIHPSKDPLEL